LYKAIAKRPSVRDGYLEHLLQLDGLTREEADQIAVERRAHLETELSEARRSGHYATEEGWLRGYWEGYKGGKEAAVDDVETAVPADELSACLHALCEVPEGFTPHKKLERLFTSRREMAEGQRPLDWGAAELAAMAT